jgi:hypothetical protein
MQDTIQFKYNKGFAYIGGTGLLLLNLWLIIMTYNDTRTVDIKDKLYLFDGALLVILIVFIVKFFIPAIKEQVALELNSEGIFDNVRHRHSSWDNIKDIKWQSFKNSSGMAVYLFDKSMFISDLSFFQRTIYFTLGWWYNTPFLIPFQYIAGDNKEIFQTVTTYFKGRKTAPNRSIGVMSAD